MIRFHINRNRNLDCNGTSRSIACSFGEHDFVHSLAPHQVARKLRWCKDRYLILSRRGYGWVGTFSVVLLLAQCVAAQGQETSPNRRETTEVIPRTDLPDPPGSIALLLDRAEVTFSTGVRPPRSTLRVPFQGQRMRIEAETEFKMQYRYRSSQRWRLRDVVADDGGSVKMLVIHVRMRELHFETTHDIWFRRRPAETGFWRNPLVLHELDHVLISSDPSLRKLFESKLKELHRIQYPFGENTKVSDALVRKIVDDRVEAAFRQVSDLASIRYVELDKVTRHGLAPLPTRYRESDWFTEPL